ncbi:predicted protein [Postia placenta Mad-698-R]|nr:predicted protein [Postia placenta Mad-698-R]
MATTGVAALPIAGTKSALKKFTEKLASLLKNVFKSDVLKYFDADRNDKRYKVKNLETYVKDSRSKSSVKSLGAWREYTRGFLTISGWLRRNQRITTDEEALYFWKGIPRLFRQLLEPRLLTAQPNHDLSKPFVMSDVNSKAEALLQRNRFDADRLPLDESSALESDSDSNDSSDSESEHDKKKRKQKAAKHKVRTKKRLVVKSEDSDNEEDIKKAQATRKKATKEMKKKANEVDNLVRQLNRMSLEDPDYGVTYLRACRLDPLVASVVRKPLIESTPPMTRPSAPMTSALRGNAQTGTPRAEMKCYGCGKLGHGLSSCPDILGLIDRGIIIRDSTTGRLTMKDGSRIFKGMDEPFTTAIERQVGPQSHFITAAEAPFCAKVEEAASEESDGDGDDEDEDEDSNTEAVYVMPVKPTEKIIRTARKQAAQGPVVPPVRIQEKVDRAKGDKQKDKPPHMNESVERRSARIQGQPAPAISDPKPDREVRPVQPHTTRNSHERVWEYQQPVDTSQRNFDPANDDEIMEDDLEPIAQKQKLAKDAKKGNKTDATPGKVDGTKRVPKKSDVQAQVDQMKILGKVLSTPVTLAVGEVFGISKEMSQHLQNVLKPKSPVVNIAASSFSTKTCGLLIRLRIEIDGRPIIAIVDTGSQLNIAHKRIWKTMLNRPMDIARSVNMNDANGGAGILQGLVENVPLTCGGVLTYANLYIGDKVPFDLLLGRPWQRENYISIDEQSDGTYLLFKDKDLEVRHEILVTPDGLDPNWSFDPAVWHSIQNSTQKGLLGQKDTRVLNCGDFREDYIYNSAYERFWQRLVHQVQQQPTPALLSEDNLLNDRLYVHDHSHPNEEPLLICGIKIPEKGGDQIASPNSESAAYEEPLQHLEIQKQKRKNLEANNWRVPGQVGTAFPEILEGGVPEDQYEMFGSNKEHTPVRTNEECTHQVARPLGLAPVCCGQEKQVVSCLRTPAEGARDPNTQLEESDWGVLGIGNEEYLTLASGSGYEPVPSDSNEVDKDTWQDTKARAVFPGNAEKMQRNNSQYEPFSQEDESVPFRSNERLLHLGARPFGIAHVGRSKDMQVMSRMLAGPARDSYARLEGAMWIGWEECYTPESERLIAAPPGMLSPLLRKDCSVKQLASTQAENEGDAENLPGDPSRERTPARANRWPCDTPQPRSGMLDVGSQSQMSPRRRAEVETSQELRRKGKERDVHANETGARTVKPAMPVLRQSTPYPSAMPPTQCYRLTSGAVGTVRFVPPTGPPPPTTRQSTGIQGDQLVLLGHHDLNVHGPANLGRLALGGNFTVRCAPQQTHLGTQQTFVVLGCVVWYTEPGESEARPYFGDAVITFTFRGPTETIVPFVHAYEPPPPPPPSAAIQTTSTTRNERPILPLPRRPPVPQERAQQERASHDIADVWLVENAAILSNILAASPSNIPAMLNARPLVPPPLSSSGLPSPSTPLLPVTTPDSCDIETLKIPGLLYLQDSTDADVCAVSPLKTNGLRTEPVQDEDEDMPSLVDWEADAGDKTSDVEILDNDTVAT